MTTLDSSDQPPASFGFSGKGGEYFRIWIVNIALTILTLGIYSAWAKVRRLKYFYQNTSLLGSHFDYHGDPKIILKGRVVAFALLLAYNLSFKASPTLGLITFALLAVVMPWLIVRSLKFKLRNSSYRGLRFSFRGTTGEGYFAYLFMPILAVFSLYLLAPLAHQNIKKYQHSRSWFGNTQFSFDAGPGKFYLLYLKLLGLALLALIVPIAIIVALKSHLAAFYSMPGITPEQRQGMGVLIGFGFIGIYLLLFVFIGPWFAARLQNLVWNHTRLGEHQLVSDVHARKMLWIMLTNLIGVILTLGLYKPFADIRLTRYRIENMGLIPHGDLDQVLADHEQDVSATGEGATDLFDIDISF